MINEFQKTASKIYEDARKEDRLIDNPNSAYLRKLALEEPEVKETRFHKK